MTVSLDAKERDALLARPNLTKNISWAWLGIVPFVIFAIAFLFLPALSLFVGSFQDESGKFTFVNIIHLFQPFVLNAYWTSIKVSLFTAIGGGLFGFLLAYSVTVGRLLKFLRTGLMTFSGVASNFAGVPLAFAFIATLGRVGMFTIILKDLLHFNRYDTGFDLYSFLGLSLTYMYFQFPLMVLVISPALDGLKQEWREASENLGASNFQFWRYVALPILMPSLIATIILLFGNAFGAYATAYALTGGNLQLVTIVIGAQIQGDVLHDVGLGNALAITSFILTWVIIGVIQLFSRGTPGQNQLGGVH